MVSTLSPPVIISAPLPPVIVKISDWSVRTSVPPDAFVLIVSIFARLPSVEKVCVPVERTRVSSPPEPSNLSASPCPVPSIVIVSSSEPPVISSVPAPTEILNAPDPAPDISMLPPAVVSVVKFATPEAWLVVVPPAENSVIPVAFNVADALT